MRRKHANKENTLDIYTYFLSRGTLIREKTLIYSDKKKSIKIKKKSLVPNGHKKLRIKSTIVNCKNTIAIKAKVWIKLWRNKKFYAWCLPSKN